MNVSQNDLEKLLIWFFLFISMMIQNSWNAGWHGVFKGSKVAKQFFLDFKTLCFDNPNMYNSSDCYFVGVYHYKLVHVHSSLLHFYEPEPSISFVLSILQLNLFVNNVLHISVILDCNRKDACDWKKINKIKLKQPANCIR